MADSSSKTSPLHEPESTAEDNQVFSYVVGSQSGPTEPQPSPYSPLAAG
jgi:hypothetical protein